VNASSYPVQIGDLRTGAPTANRRHLRAFGAIARGISLVTARWRQTRALFDPGADLLVSHDGHEMTRCWLN